jgi:hypothetical protein
MPEEIIRLQAMAESDKAADKEIPPVSVVSWSCGPHGW